jgi:cell wall-associated NlpC family hydrolase
MSGKHRKEEVSFLKKVSGTSGVPFPYLVSLGILGSSWIGLVSAGSGSGDIVNFNAGMASGAVTLEQPKPAVAVTVAVPKVVVPPGEIAVGAALSKIGIMYKWGGKDFARDGGVDCSGLTQWAWKQAGVKIDVDTYRQIDDGVAVSADSVAPGDLIFPWIGHVVMYIGDGKVVEAPGRGQRIKVSSMPNRYIAIRKVSVS